MAKNYYELHVAGCTRQLPIIKLNDDLAIAGFVILGDVDIVSATAKELVKKMPAHTDVIMTAETKGIPLAHEMARLSGMKQYVVARKSVKAYMDDPIWVEDESITTAGKQRLYLSAADVALLRGRNVLLVDDVISTGGSMKALKALAEKAGAHIAGQAAIWQAGMRQNGERYHLSGAAAFVKAGRCRIICRDNEHFPLHFPCLYAKLV